MTQGMRPSSEGERCRVIAAVAELAGDGLAERMRLDAATRVLVGARRLLAVAPHEASSGPHAGAVLRVARGWDPSATTASEYVESLAPTELDLFLAAAPGWATSVREAGGGPDRRAA